MTSSPAHWKDGYKADHRPQFPEGTEYVYSNLTARKSRIPGVNHYVVFGVLAAVTKLKLVWDKEFFQQPTEAVIGAYKRRMDTYLGPDAVSVAHIRELHELGYLPLEIKALPEGTLCPIGVPCLTIVNTNPRFFWLTNFLETFLSCELWHPMTTATIAFEYRSILDRAARRTSDIPEFVDWQGHDFSMRGQVGVEAAAKSGAGHLLSFFGTDTIPAIDFLEEHYGADASKELIGGSVAATEHAVMCMGGAETELETFKRLITKVYPKGIVSIVSDTWDYWNVITNTAPALTAEIMGRDGKVVFRPDSGDPVKILCGDPKALATHEREGTVETLYRLFGGTVNSKGFKQLDPHVGVIYGDSITLDIAREVCQQLQDKGFASTNVVFGIGSFTYQHVTRDTLGFAIKATNGIVNGQGRSIYKKPKTDDGTKNSARGLLYVGADLSLEQNVTPSRERTGALACVFHDGIITRRQTLAEIRAKLKERRA